MKKILSIVSALAVLSGCSDSSTSGNVTLKSSSTALASKILGASAVSSLKLKIYKFAVSTNADCSSPVTVYENSSPSYSEFGSVSTIGSGDLADGSYPCIMFEISDLVKFTPSVGDSDQCVVGEEESLEVCADHGGGFPAYQLIDGSTGTCTSGEDRVGMFISTNSTTVGGGESNNVFQPPASSGDATRGLNLDGAFTVSGTAIAVLHVVPPDSVSTDGDRCDMQPPTFSFSDE